MKKVILSIVIVVIIVFALLFLTKSINNTDIANTANNADDLIILNEMRTENAHKIHKDEHQVNT